MILDKQALRAALLGSTSPPAPISAGRCYGPLNLRMRACLKRGGGEVRLVLPANSGGEIPFQPMPSLNKAVARAHDW
jgi:hypothetical protein